MNTDERSYPTPPAISRGLARGRRLSLAVQLRDALQEIATLRRGVAEALMRLSPADYQRLTEAHPEGVPADMLCNLLARALEEWTDQVQTCVQFVRDAQRQAAAAQAQAAAVTAVSLPGDLQPTGVGGGESLPPPLAPAPQEPGPKDLAEGSEGDTEDEPSLESQVQAARERLEKTSLNQVKRARAVLEIIWTQGINGRARLLAIWRQGEDAQTFDSSKSQRSAFDTAVSKELQGLGLVTEERVPSYLPLAKGGAVEAAYLVLTATGQSVCQQLFPGGPAQQQVDRMVSEWKTLEAGRMAAVCRLFLDYRGDAAVQFRVDNRARYIDVEGRSTATRIWAQKLALMKDDEGLASRCEYVVVDPHREEELANIPGARYQYDVIPGAPEGIHFARPDFLVQVGLIGIPTSTMVWAAEVERGRYGDDQLEEKWLRALYCYPYPLLIVTEPGMRDRISKTLGRALDRAERHFLTHGMATAQVEKRPFDPYVVIYTIEQLALLGLGTANLVRGIGSESSKDPAADRDTLPVFISRNFKKARN